MSSDIKKTLLALFIVIDCLLLTLIFKTNTNTKVSLEAQNANHKSMANKIEIEEEIITEPAIVYDNLTYDELIASTTLELGVDPYMVTAIMLQETGCKWTCSDLVKYCNNVGGQKGYGCGSYSAFNTLDEGIVAMINNLYYNYYARGLTTPESINTVYAESQSWSYNVNRYIEEIRNN